MHFPSTSYDLDAPMEQILYARSVLKQKFDGQHVDVVRPDWVDFGMSIAVLVSVKSHDAETQHGCYIEDKDHKPVSFGYNGFPKNGKLEKFLPNIRPFKYPFMRHAERNALDNCMNLERLKGATMYVTGRSCQQCTLDITHTDVAKVVFLGGYSSKLLDAETEQNCRIIIANSHINFKEVEIDDLPLTKNIQEVTRTFRGEREQ